jgi:hypothetical protein
MKLKCTFRARRARRPKISHLYGRMRVRMGETTVQACCAKYGHREDALGRLHLIVRNFLAFYGS